MPSSYDDYTHARGPQLDMIGHTLGIPREHQEYDLTMDGTGRFTRHRCYEDDESYRVRLLNAAYELTPYHRDRIEREARAMIDMHRQPWETTIDVEVDQGALRAFVDTALGEEYQPEPPRVSIWDHLLEEAS